MGIEEMFVGAALKAMREKTDEMNEKFEKLAPHFETEEEALAYARRLAALRPGDVVKVPNKGVTALISGVFVGLVNPDDGPAKASVLLWHSEKRRLFQTALSLFSVVLD